MSLYKNKEVDVRNYKSVIKEAWLLVSTPQQVTHFLEQRAAKPEEVRFERDADEELEQALLDRNDPQINLALARYAFYDSVVRKLFANTHDADGYGRAIRFSVLSNQCVGSNFCSSLPEALFEDKEQGTVWLASASLEEIGVLFENPSLNDSFLLDFLEGKESWQAMGEDQRLAAITALSQNKRMQTPYNKSFMDGYTEYSYEAVFNAAWKLAETAPVTDIWASRLHWLFDVLQQDAFSIENPLELAKRWIPEPSNAKAIQCEQEGVKRGNLSSYQGIRKGLATLALSKSSALLPQLLDADDAALRCAAYAAGDLSPELITASYERDGKLAFMESVHNKSLWRYLETREALHQAAWSVVNNDKHSDLMAANIFNNVKENMAKDHPDWFKDEDYQPEIEDGAEPITKEDLSRATDAISHSHATAIEQIRQSLSGLDKRIGWIWWFSLGAAAASIYRYL